MVDGEHDKILPRLAVKVSRSRIETAAAEGGGSTGRSAEEEKGDSGAVAGTAR
jgi:hypothetical protein